MFVDLLLYACKGRSPDEWSARIPGAMSTRVFADWGELARLFPRSKAIVAEVEDLNVWDQLRDLKRLASEANGKPIILITRKDVENVVAVADVACDAILWCDTPARKIRMAIAASLERASLLPVLAAVADHVSPTLERALRTAFEQRPPFRTVAEWAQAVRIDRRTLWSEWNRAYAGSPPLNLKDLIRWIVLAEAVARKRPGLAWCGVARELRVHEHTIFRLGKRLLEASPRELASLSVSDAAARLREAVAA